MGKNEARGKEVGAMHGGKKRGKMEFGQGEREREKKWEQCTGKRRGERDGIWTKGKEEGREMGFGQRERERGKGWDFDKGKGRAERGRI